MLRRPLMNNSLKLDLGAVNLEGLIPSKSLSVVEQRQDYYCYFSGELSDTVCLFEFLNQDGVSQKKPLILKTIENRIKPV